MDATKRALLEQLSGRIRGLEQHGVEHLQRACISTHIKDLDELLPGHGLPLGALTEVLAEAGTGALTLALLLGKSAIERGNAWAVVDPHGTFYPPAAQALGLDVSRLILLRPNPQHPQHTGWCFTQALRCSEIGASFLMTRSGDNMAYRRFQLAVERGGGQGFIVRPTDAVRKPCWAALRLRVAWPDERADVSVRLGSNRCVRLNVLHVRSGAARTVIKNDKLKIKKRTRYACTLKDAIDVRQQEFASPRDADAQDV